MSSADTRSQETREQMFPQTPSHLLCLFLQLQDICRIPSEVNVALQLQGVLANGATWFVSFKLCQLREEDWFYLHHLFSSLVL